MACLYLKKILNLADQKEYKRLIAGFKNGEEYFIDSLRLIPESVIKIILELEKLS